MVNVNTWEVQGEVTYLLLSRVEHFASELIFRENLSLIVTNNTSNLSGSLADTSPEKQFLIILLFKNFVWKLIDVYLTLQKSLVYFLKVFMLI